jgi:hypothetical protein
MRYSRGQPLTVQERAGGGQGAGRNWLGNFGAGGGIRGESTGSAYSGGGDFGQILQQLMQQYQPQESYSDVLETKARLRNPEEYARRNYMANTYAAPFAPGGAFEGRMAADTMTPAQIMASQGMSAKNQWASQLPAGSSAGGVDTDELRRLNAQQAGRFKTYM